MAIIFIYFTFLFNIIKIGCFYLILDRKADVSELVISQNRENQIQLWEWHISANLRHLRCNFELISLLATLLAFSFVLVA